MRFFARSFVALALLCAAFAGAASLDGHQRSRPEPTLSLVSSPVPETTSSFEVGETEVTVTTEVKQPAESFSSPAPNVSRVQQGVASGECANPVISEATARAESGCRWDAHNPTGCEGYGCTGFYQIHGGHYMDPSPWGGRGACVGLDKWEPVQQTACAQRLGPGAWG